jgi:microcin C transport system substrate-binding protein
VFGEPFVPPVSDGSGQDRVLLRKASALLQEAGYHIKQGKRITPKGNLFTAEFLIADPVSLPHHNAFIKNLGILGIEANVRIVDAVQYRRRLPRDSALTTVLPIADMVAN